MSSELSFTKGIAATYVVAATVISGAVGTLAIAGKIENKPEEKYTVLNKQMVKENVYTEANLIPFILSVDSLTRNWDFSVKQVCTLNRKTSLLIFVPLRGQSMSCQPMSDFPDKKVKEVRAKLPGVTFTN